MARIDDIRVLKAQKGDRHAFEEIVREQHTRLYHVCLRMMASPEDAADMVQDIWIKVWRNLPRFKGDSSLSTWLYRIAMNTCLDELRRKKRAAQISIDALTDIGWEPSDPEAETLLARSIDRTLITQALHRLPDEYRSVIVLRDITGLSYEEMAQVLDVPLGTVRSRLSRARRQMAKILLELEPNILGSV